MATRVGSAQILLISVDINKDTAAATTTNIGTGTTTGAVTIGNTTSNPVVKIDTNRTNVVRNDEVYAGAPRGLRIIRGTVASNGVALFGQGFTSVRNSTGKYTISFTTPFTDIPTITTAVVPNWDLWASAQFANLGARPTVDGCEIWTIDDNGLDFHDNEFNFIAIGPMSTT